MSLTLSRIVFKPGGPLLTECGSSFVVDSLAYFKKVTSLVPLNTSCIEAPDTSVEVQASLFACTVQCSRQASCFMFSFESGNASSCKMCHTSLTYGDTDTNDRDLTIYERFADPVTEFSEHLARGE